MPGSYPSSPPLGSFINGHESSTEPNRPQITNVQNSHHADYPQHDHHSFLHRRRNHSTQAIVSTDNRHSAANAADSNGRSASRQLVSDLASRFSEFVRPPRQIATSQNPVIESYIDTEDYQSLLAAVSSIHMSRPQQQDSIQSVISDRDLSEQQSPVIQIITQPDDDDVDVFDEQTLEAEEVDEIDEMYDSATSSVIEDIYDLQHIMIHNQREFENQMRQAREDYARHRDDVLAEIEQNQQNITQNRFDAQSNSLYEMLNSPSDSTESLSIEQTQINESTVEHYSNITDNPRPTISSSYFSPTTESTIVLSSPPPGRTSIGNPHHNGPQVSNRPSFSAPNHVMNSTAESLQFDIDDTMEFSDNHIVIGENEGGQWSILGSLTRATTSFEQHRHQLYQQQQQERRQQQQHDPVHHSQENREFSEGNISDHSISTQPILRIHHDTATRRNPHAVAPMPFANYGPASPLSNIPIPSRYINPSTFGHSHVNSTSTATSTSSSIFRPSNIITGQNQHSHRRSNVTNDYESTSGPRRRVVNGATNSYSETVERAEAGGWAPASHMSVTGTTPASWYDDPYEYRGRNNISLKEVIRMACRFCETLICERGMKAQLLADQSVALLSTDDAPQSVQLIGVDYKPTNCLCRIRDTACLVCGNAIGYHITQPCDRCLNAENNGHLWLFHPEFIISSPRMDPIFIRPLRWGELPHPEQDFDTLSLGKVMQGGSNGSVVVGGMVRREYDAICR
ncbi:Protein fam72a [Linnemannia zychae]|nr:Protein fam72a [Linnemannia zychae]